MSFQPPSDQTVLGSCYQVCHDPKICPEGPAAFRDIRCVYERILLSPKAKHHRYLVIEDILENNRVEFLPILRQALVKHERMDIDERTDIYACIHKFDPTSDILGEQTFVLQEALARINELIEDDLPRITRAVRTIEKIGTTEHIDILVRCFGMKLGIHNWVSTALARLGYRESDYKGNLTFAPPTLNLKAYLCACKGAMYEFSQNPDFYKEKWFFPEQDQMISLIQGDDPILRTLALLAICRVPANKITTKATTKRLRKAIGPLIRNADAARVPRYEVFAMTMCSMSIGVEMPFTVTL